ncbi:pentatricopeptide repeat-containing protein At2g38420, mitochondrial [Cicer arietinum]|uniref:Pentatricopeptide repeat-containing protein At2g38420, mitochondrial n=1 Tax=Cicer arietinum TaxID=3827 RepID=A0A1S3E0W6_CICAR|nr:pentatricopeptide repeat-containing protein At2g38420, mitochondrial [Cicer arietinum]XP_012569084.1 pentatricopeptide repeat-containing protein At2g38420, mitochondrial [Cicer arietinum]
MVRNPLSKTANKYLRKFRKWPHSPYKTTWHHTFGEQQAMHILKQATFQMSSTQQQPQTQINNNPFLLSTLIDSFKAYNTDPTPKAYYFLVKTITNTSQLHEIPHILNHLEHIEKFETPEFIFCYLIRFYGLADRVQDAVDLFFRIPRFRCTPTVYSLNLLLSLLCRKREFLKMVPNILLKSQHMKIRLEESTFRVLVKALCRIKRVDYAIKIMNCMIEDGYSLDDKICSLIISSLCEQEDLTSVEALVVWGNMRKLGFCPGVMDCTNMIRFLVKEGKGKDALEILNQLKEDGIKPDIVCYTIVMSGFVKEDDYVKLDELFDEILVLGLVPDVYTYNVYINGLCKQNNVDEALKIVVSMEKLGCKPNVVTYNTLLGALCMKGDLGKAKTVFKEIGLKGVELNLHTYRIMLDGLVGKGEIGEACVLLEEMSDKCFYPRSSTFDSIILHLCQKGLIGDATVLMNKIVAKSFVPGAKVWEAMLLNSGSELTYSETTFVGLFSPQ